ncbi:MAG TPA: DsbA family protein [Segeticoccus sp.]|uniref:DsbA family oxidoreductase n=1 Tax=Segeticoccus sp. TaxID=2706531 RepID=UPI002D80CE48|nr:DsbA family protein [Segeticoccus sp.]HET8601847.1 DsbA family protein [Segeticoccus sp.]
MAPNNSTPGVVTVWSDIACPWATMALQTLHRQAAERGADLRIDHRCFPLELLNGEPTAKPMHDEEVERITAVRSDLGWSTWTGPEWAYPVTTLPAMEAVQAAKVQGLQAADALDAALRRAYFVEQRCVSMLPVIEDVARGCAGVDADRLMAALHAGTGRAAVFADLAVAGDGQVQGSPHFWTAEGPFAANPGVDDVEHFRSYDAGWVDELLGEQLS